MQHRKDRLPKGRRINQTLDKRLAQELFQRIGHVKKEHSSRVLLKCRIQRLLNSGYLSQLNCLHSAFTLMEAMAFLKTSLFCFDSFLPFKLSNLAHLYCVSGIYMVFTFSLGYDDGAMGCQSSWDVRVRLLILSIYFSLGFCTILIV